MKIDWKRIEDYEVQAHASCLVTTVTTIGGVDRLAVAFKTSSGEWQVGNGKICWFEPTYFAYLNECWEEEEK